MVKHSNGNPPSPKRKSIYLIVDVPASYFFFTMTFLRNTQLQPHLRFCEWRLWGSHCMRVGQVGLSKAMTDVFVWKKEVAQEDPNPTLEVSPKQNAGCFLDSGMRKVSSVWPSAQYDRNIVEWKTRLYLFCVERFPDSLHWQKQIEDKEGFAHLLEMLIVLVVIGCGRILIAIARAM